MFKQVAVSDLQTGMMVTKVIEQSGRVRIRKVGFIRSPEMITGLKEMGVISVEVDLEQSLNVEFEKPNESANNEVQDENTDKTTATQQLVASDKQIADVDRQLSQQFHRSLFMPAVEQMPSKWVLYGKPYALLFTYVVLGLFIGGGTSYLIADINESPKTVLTDTVKSETSNKEKLAGSEQSINNAEELTSDDSLGTNKESEIAAKTIQETSIANNDDKNKQDTLPTEQSKSVNNVNEVNEQTSAPLQLVNGVLLEEGQTVLGYNGSNDKVEDSKQNESAINESKVQDIISGNEIVNSDLYRRIQRAAKDVDEQPNEPKPETLKVTNLNDLPRIDQLSAALLTQMPAMRFSAHMYASNPQDRWVRVNSRRLGEGDIIANDVILKRIESEKVVLEYKGKEFTMNALSDW